MRQRQKRSLVRAWRTRIGLLLAILVLVMGVAFGVLWTGLAEAERGLLEALEGKAKTHARIVRGDVELALSLDIPLAELPGAYEYLEEGAQADPDIRFVAITDAGLTRLHYGGIGRARLDPLLDREPVPAVAMNVASHPDQPLQSVAVEGFSITPAPLFKDGRHEGFVVVAVQGKQIHEALVERLGGLVPAALAFLVLLLELVVWTSARTLEEPWRRLRRMLRRLVDGRRLLWSTRHDRSELGTAMRLANGVFHRLKDRAERVAMRAREAERAVFDPEIARAVRRRLAALDEPPLLPLTAAPEMPVDRRPSDVQPAIVLFAAAAALGLFPALWPAGWPLASLLLEVAPPPAAMAAVVPALLGAAAGIVFALLLRRAGWLLVVAGLTLAAVALAGPALPLPAAGLLAAVFTVTAAAGRLHLATALDIRAGRWLAFRMVAGITAGVLLAITLLIEERLAVLPWLQLALLGLAVLASNSEGIVRRQLFAETGPAG